MLNGKRIGAVVLAYKVAEQIERVLRTMPEFVDKVYVINDASPDDTAAVIRRAADKRVAVLNHGRNAGPGAGLYAGLVGAAWDGMDVVVKVDGDGQMNPDRMIDLIYPILIKDADYTKGERLSLSPLAHGMPRVRLVGNKILTQMTRAVCGGGRICDTQNGYVAMNSAVLLELVCLRFCSSYGYLNDILVKVHHLGYRTADVPMPAVYGNEKSSVRFGKYVITLSLLLLRLTAWRWWRALTEVAQ